MYVCMHVSTLMPAQVLSVFSENVGPSVHIQMHRDSFVSVHVQYMDMVVGMPCGNVWMSTSVTAWEMRGQRGREGSAALREVSIAWDGAGCLGGSRGVQPGHF